MSGLLYVVMQWCVTALPASAVGHRVSGQALADWRYELAGAHTWRARQVVNVRSAWAVVRTLVQVGVDEMPQAARSAFMWKLGLAICLSLGWILSEGMSASAERFFLVVPAGKAWVLLALSLLPQVLLPLPLLVFAAEAVGPRRWETPVPGVMIWVVGLATTSMVTGLIAATYLQYENWFYFGNALTPAPSFDLPGAIILAPMLSLSALSFSALSLLLLTLAHYIRKVGGWVGWSVGLAPMLGLWALVGLLPFAAYWLPTSAHPFVPVMVGLRLSTPLLAVVWILWAISRLAKIADHNSQISITNNQ